MKARLRCLAAAALLLAARAPLARGADASPGAFLQVDSTRIWYEEAGPAGAPTVVLLHDGLLHSVTWDAVWPALAHDFHVIRYDRRGMGRSGPPRIPFIPTEDLLALLDRLHVARATLIGSSSGSGLAVDFAIRHPERVERLVLIGPVVHGMPSSAHFDARGARNNAPLARGDARAAARNWAEDRWQIAGPAPAARRALFEGLAASPQNLRYDGALERRFLVPAVARLSEIHAPTLILVGEGDIPDVQAYAGALEAGIWGASREVVGGAGHLVQLEKPGWLARRVADFIVATPVADVSADRLEGLAGTYERAMFGGDAELVARDGRLMLHLPTERDQPLHAASDSTFYMLPWGGYRFVFRREAGGRASAVEVTHGGESVRAPRRAPTGGAGDH